MAPRPTLVLQRATSGSSLRTSSILRATVSLAKIDEFCGSAMSTSNSGRSEDGKNWLGMSRIANIDAINMASVAASVSHLARSAQVRNERYVLKTQPGSDDFAALGGLRMATPRSGANRTATNHDAISAMVTTAKSVNVYSPAPLAAKPTGTKPAIVTSVPASI